jgi:four helix bundle protein
LAFEALLKLDAWRRACRLAVEIFHLTDQCRHFAYRDQVTRSALSIASNIAEGYERDTQKDRIRFLYTAKGSCAECWTQLLIGMEAGLVERDKARRLVDEAQQVARMISGLIRSFQKQI